MQENPLAHKSSWKVPTAIACGALACTLSISSALAYLTDDAFLSNPFTLNTDLSIELSEPSFEANAAKGLAPAQTVAKDPLVRNTGSLGAYVAATVKVPVFTGDALNAEGALTHGENADLFSYTVNTGWHAKGDATLKDGFRTYTYVYDELLAPNAVTPPLFDSVTLANLIQNIGVSATSIDVNAFAIQSEGFANAMSAIDAYLGQKAAITTAASVSS